MSRFIQPAKLANDCRIPFVGGQSVIATGMGRVKTNQFIPIPERQLRQASFVTVSSEDCSNDMFFKLNPHMIVCTRANSRGQMVFAGDSGI